MDIKQTFSSENVCPLRTLTKANACWR